MAPLAVMFTLLSLPAFAAGTSSAPATMQWQVRDLTATRQVRPAWPAGTPSRPDGVACRAAVRIDGNGVPMQVAVEGCPTAFATETERAIGQWRWSPWASIAERRVTLNVRFPGQQTLVQATRQPARPSLAAQVVPETLPEPHQVVCSGTIKRNRRGMASRVRVAACPPAYEGAAYEALREISKTAARKAGRDEPRTREQPVRISFSVDDI